MPIDFSLGFWERFRFALRGGVKGELKIALSSTADEVEIDWISAHFDAISVKAPLRIAHEVVDLRK